MIKKILMTAIRPGLFLTLFSLVFFALAFKPDQEAEAVRVIKKEQLADLIKAEESGITVVHFWATWCGPCVKELPDFEKAAAEFTEEKVNWRFISFDFVEDKEKVNHFLEGINLKGDQYLLDESDYDPIIRSVDDQWSGALPYTLVLYKDKRRAHSGAFSSREELIQSFKTILKEN